MLVGLGQRGCPWITGVLFLVNLFLLFQCYKFGSYLATFVQFGSYLATFVQFISIYSMTFCYVLKYEFCQVRLLSV